MMLGFSPEDCKRISETVIRSEHSLRGAPRHRRARSEQDALAGERFLNSSGSQAPLGALLRIVSTEYVEGFDPIFTIGKPNSTFQRHYLVNIGGDVDDGQLGVGSWLHEADFFLADSSPAVGDSYGATPSSWQATKGGYGFTVTGGTNGSGATQRVTGRQEFANELIGKADLAITKGSTGTFSIWCRNSSGTLIDSTFDISGVALFANVPATPKYSQAAWLCGGWIIGMGDCP